MPAAAEVEAAAGGAQASQGLAQLGKRHALDPAGGDGGQRVAEVVLAGQGQLDPAHQCAVFVEVGAGAVTPLLAGDGGEVHPLGAAGRPPVGRLEVLPQDRTVAVGQQGLRAFGEALQGGDQRVEVRVVVGVVELHVGEHRQVGPELHQGAIGFVGFGHQQATRPMAAIAAEGGHHAADHGGGVVVGGLQQGGHQGAGGGFAVGAGNGDRGLGVDQGGQHIGAVHHREAAAAGLLQLGIARRHGRADHHHGGGGGAAADGGHGGGVLLAEHPHAQAAQLLNHPPLFGVGARHVEAPLRQDPGQGRHADATDSDEMEGLAAIEQQSLGQVRGSRTPGRR